jgi:hypothetical protein
MYTQVKVLEFTVIVFLGLTNTKSTPHGCTIVRTFYTIKSLILGRSMQYEGKGIKSNTSLDTIIICRDLIVFYNDKLPKSLTISKIFINAL